MLDKKPIYFTIDFECFTFNKLREIGYHSPVVNKPALNASYDNFKYLSKKYLNNKKVTFFTTGLLARKHKSLIRKIYDDGHEVACHYNMHDHISQTNRKDLSDNLDKAIESIYEATGEPPKGFRAPYFDIEPHQDWAYEEIAKRFLYDSSYRTSEVLGENGINRIMSVNKYEMNEYYIFKHRIFNDLINVGIGGTFLRLFPVKLLLNAIKESEMRNHIPIIYLHSYELMNGADYWVSWGKFNKVNKIKSLYQWFRQIQWTIYGQKSVEKKLDKIFTYYSHQGKMESLINK